MSNLADKTEEKAIALCAKCVVSFEQLHCLNMTSEDAFAAREAENLLRSIIETNGYQIVYRSKSGKPYKRLDK
jgi:hypothetical protein